MFRSRQPLPCQAKKPINWMGIGWLAMTYVALVAAASNAKFVTFDASKFHELFRAKYEAILPVVVAHGATGIAALVLGPWLFLERLRARSPRLHRAAGRVYLALVLAGGTTGLFMATMAHGGPVSEAGLSALALLWLYTGWRGYRAARARAFAEHRRWMIRNYALTMGAVAIRLYIHLGAGWLGFDYDALYRAVCWLSWIPQAAAVELAFALGARRAARG